MFHDYEAPHDKVKQAVKEQLGYLSHASFDVYASEDTSIKSPRRCDEYKHVCFTDFTGTQIRKYDHICEEAMAGRIANSKAREGETGHTFSILYVGKDATPEKSNQSET